MKTDKTKYFSATHPNGDVKYYKIVEGKMPKEVIKVK